MENTVKNNDIVEYVASLARLSFSEKEKELFKKQLDNILGYIKSLDEVEVTDIRPMIHAVSSMKNVFREDKVKDCLQREQALLNAPDKNEEFFKVPKII